MSTAPLLTEHIPPRAERRHGKHYGDTYGESRTSEEREPTRIRLTAAEARPIRYVLSEWAGEVGLASTLPTQIGMKLEEQACKDEDGQDYRLALARLRRPTEGTPQTISCHGSRSTSFHGWEMLALDRWVDVRGGERGAERRERIKCWRALRAMADARDDSLVILNALYGDRLPGLPSPGLWNKAVDWDYMRVVRYVERPWSDDARSWSGAALDAATLVDRRKRDGEPDAQRAARIAGLDAAKYALLRELAEECEFLIVAAAHAYRRAWQSA